MPLCEHNTLGECAHKYAPSLVLISISVAWWSPSFSSTILQGDDRRPTKTDLFWLPLLPATQAQLDVHQHAHFASWLTYLSCLQSTSQSSLTDFFSLRSQTQAEAAAQHRDRVWPANAVCSCIMQRGSKQHGKYWYKTLRNNPMCSTIFWLSFRARFKHIPVHPPQNWQLKTEAIVYIEAWMPWVG